MTEPERLQPRRGTTGRGQSRASGASILGEEAVWMPHVAIAAFTALRHVHTAETTDGRLFRARASRRPDRTCSSDEAASRGATRLQFARPPAPGSNWSDCCNAPRTSHAVVRIPVAARFPARKDLERFPASFGTVIRPAKPIVPRPGGSGCQVAPSWSRPRMRRRCCRQPATVMVLGLRSLPVAVLYQTQAYAACTSRTKEPL